MKKLNSACFAIRSLKVFLTINDLKITYFAYVHSIITYGIAFWGNATNSKNVCIIIIIIIIKKEKNYKKYYECEY
jgi:hypothetical protein